MQRNGNPYTPKSILQVVTNLQHYSRTHNSNSLHFMNTKDFRFSTRSPCSSPTWPRQDSVHRPFRLISQQFVNYTWRRGQTHRNGHSGTSYIMSCGVSYELRALPPEGLGFRLRRRSCWSSSRLNSSPHPPVPYWNVTCSGRSVASASLAFSDRGSSPPLSNESYDRF